MDLQRPSCARHSDHPIIIGSSHPTLHASNDPAACTRLLWSQLPTLFTVQQQMKEASRTDLYVTLVPDNPQQVSLTLSSMYVFFTHQLQAYTYVDTYTHMHTYICTQPHACMHAHYMHTRMRTHTQTHTLHAHTHTHTHARARAYTHTRARTHAPTMTVIFHMLKSNNMLISYGTLFKMFV